MVRKRRKKKNLNLHVFIILILITIMVYSGYLFVNFLKENDIIESNKNNTIQQNHTNKDNNINENNKKNTFNNILNEIKNSETKSANNNNDNQSNSNLKNNKDKVGFLTKILNFFKKNNSNKNKKQQTNNNENYSNNNVSNETKFDKNLNTDTSNENDISKEIVTTQNTDSNDNLTNENNDSLPENTSDDNKNQKISDQNINKTSTENVDKEIKTENKIDETIHYGNFNVYLCVVHDDGSLELKKVPAKIKYTDSPIFATISYLVNLKKEGYLNLIPEGTSLKEAWIKNGILYLNFNKNFLHNSYGLKAIDAQIKQIVKTALQFKNVKGVKFQIEGKTQKYFSDEGYILDVIFK